MPNEDTLKQKLLTFGAAYFCSRDKTWRSLVEGYKYPMIQLDPIKTMLVICHSENTFNKERFLTETSPFVKSTNMRLRDFVTDKNLRAFYEHA